VTGMSHSTPKRRLGSKQSSSDHFPHSHPSKQDTLKQTVANELAGVTWELDTTTLARALSLKKRKVGGPPLTIDLVDSLENYDIKIDELDSVFDDAANALKSGTEPLPTDTSESVHYQPPLAIRYYDFLNVVIIEAGLVETCNFSEIEQGAFLGVEATMIVHRGLAIQRRGIKVSAKLNLLLESIVSNGVQGKSTLARFKQVSSIRMLAAPQLASQLRF
jgi:hypothetical protein